MKRIDGFTVTELLVVMTLLSSIPVSSYVGVKNKALQAQCTSNMRQIGMAIKMFVMSEGRYPDADFYPEEPLKDPKSIVLILKSYGIQEKIFLCPTAPPVLKEKGLTYLWNDELSGKNPSSIKNPSKTWLMVDVTALDKRVSSHLGGYNILYADGHVEWSTEPLPFIPKK
ncbi:MAG TPA: hypothetical protein EYP78_00635 [Candidatus Omnitrophica bacterium]|nr:hypothetical protein [Candidatus Omnitrophota bacterium]